MEYQQIFLDLCVDLQSELNQQELYATGKLGKNKVLYEFTEVPYEQEKKFTLAIRVNDVIIFKETYFRNYTFKDITTSAEVDEKDKHIKYILHRKMLNTIFSYGIMSAKRIIDERDNEIKKQIINQQKNKDNDGGKIKGTDNY